MKAFVLKNNKGLYYTVHLNSEDIHTQDISKANIFNKEIANNMKLFLNKTTYEKWELVEITITESDLEQENKQLEEQHNSLIDEFQKQRENLCKQIKQESDARERFVKKVKRLKEQLEEKDKEIEKLKDEIARHNYAEHTTDYWVRKNIKEQQIRKQVCDEIRDRLKDKLHNYYPSIDYVCMSVHAYKSNEIKEILDQIEQGERNER